ncbi:MAG: hypothetical protein K2J84_02690 [Bacteroidaceae bacterium]|nr:hypothetical protein [Bacteroidaceae bacterium]
MKTNNIDKHDDALRQAMRRIKDTREAPRLSADFEDRVMAQIEAIAPLARRQSHQAQHTRW